MRYFLFSILSLIPFASSFADDLAKDRAKLEGAWVGVKATWNGKPLTDEQAKQFALTLSPKREAFDLSGGFGVGFRLTVPSKVLDYKRTADTGKEEIIYRETWEGTGWGIDKSKDTDLPILSASRSIGLKAQTIGGLFRLDGDKLTVCIRLDGGWYAKELRSTADSQTQLLELKHEPKRGK